MTYIESLKTVLENPSAFNTYCHILISKNKPFEVKKTDILKAISEYESENIEINHKKYLSEKTIEKIKSSLVKEIRLNKINNIF
jgi:hypothetical protein